MASSLIANSFWLIAHRIYLVIMIGYQLSAGQKYLKFSPHPLPLPSACLPVGRGRGEGWGTLI
jgi:hypothetical protein